MTVAEFHDALVYDEPPAGLTAPLLALWHDGRGDWTGAHDVAQTDETATGSWIHAYLHRKEGDVGNAGYWYRRAGKPAATGSLAAEWEGVVATLLG